MLLAAFVELIERPVARMSHFYAWLGVTGFEINPEKLVLMGKPESDSTTSPSIQSPEPRRLDFLPRNLLLRSF